MYLCIQIATKSTLMTLKRLLPLFLAMQACTMMMAETVTEHILHTVDSGEGQWPCLFYELNYNTDIAVAERAKWYSPDEDESYWREGVGPFSIDQNKFLVTQWQSTVHPILIRRHFTLDAEDLLKISIGSVALTYSYDENPTFWLNGTKIASATGWNDDRYATLRLTGARKKLLVEGDNVLCVSVQQGAGGGHIDYGLSLTYNSDHTGIGPILLPDEEETVDGKWTNGRCYDLSGRPGGSDTRGVVIIGKKKVVRK